MTKKVICVLLILLLLLQYGLILQSTAATYGPQPAPERLRVEAIYDVYPNIQPPIGYNEFDKYYVDLKSDKVKLPADVPSPSIYLNYYLQEVNKPYKPVKPVILKEGNVPAETAADNMIRLKNLSSGTVYYAHSTAYYTYTVDNTTYKSSESGSSNIVKFLTDIEINAYSYGPNQIKIEWDDVWNSGRRMEYRLYISENKTFANTYPIYITQDKIGQNGPVTVNETTGKLEYIHTVRDPGRVYYVKVVPDTSETELRRSPESPTVSVSSFILAKTTKMSSTPDGTIWKLEWSPVVTGLADSDIKVTYQIYKGTGTGNGIEEYMASVDDTSFFITLRPGEENNYYVIKAIVTRNGEDYYPGIKIQSQKIYIKESEVPAVPAVPEIVPEFRNAGETIISYADELKPDSATILWKAPLKGNGEIDTDVKYDIWLIGDPNQLGDPPSNTLIASSIRMNDSNFVKSGSLLLGYKYKINDLIPNSTYYFRIVAKKDYVDFVDNELRNITLQSEAAVKVIITPSRGPIDQPVVPGRPPLSVKKDKDGKDMVSTDSVVITLKNKWYEMFVEADPNVQGSKAAWVYKTPAQLEAISPGIVADIENGTADPLKFRKVEYDSGVTIDVGCIEYSPDFDYEQLKEIAANKIIGFPTTPNDPGEDTTAEDAIPDGKKHNINIRITDLDPNKTYIIWVRAARRSVNLISGPSDPVVITTIPVLDAELETPTVPVFNYASAADTYIDLGWNFNLLYTYNLKYGTVDDISRATGSAVITPADLFNTSYYRVTDLKPDTVYYFWIQAEVTNEAGEKKSSEFSDSYVVKTEKLIPPPTPKGFGVKGTPDSVTKNSITYEWIAEEGMEYILEIADSVEYKNSTKYAVGSVSEYTVENLRSNFRYFARLYAYDPQKDLTSEPTQSVTVRTLRSGDDYDSDVDSDNEISGDIVVKDSWQVNGVWTVRITGVNADRFVRQIQTDNKLDYTLNLYEMPSGTKEISVLLSVKVITGLDKLGENLSIRTQRNTLVIRPGMLSAKTLNIGTKGFDVVTSPEAVLEFRIILDSALDGIDKGNINFKTPVSELKITLQYGLQKPILRFDSPMKIIYEYNSPGWYKQGATSGYVLASGDTAWKKEVGTGTYDSDSGVGRFSFETLYPGKLAAGEPGNKYYDDISRSYAASSIANVASVYNLKSVTGRKFEPDKYLTVGDGVKFMLDVLGVEYSGNYMTLAIRSGIAGKEDINNTSANCTREKFIAMVIRVCEIKTSQKANASVNTTTVYKDINQVTPALLPKIIYAYETGVITSRYSDTLGPKDPITRAEAMVLTEKMLRFAGEL